MICYSFARVCLSLVSQGTAPGILGGIVKGLKGGKVSNAADLVANSKSNLNHLEQIFRRNPFPEPVLFTKDDQIIVDELDIGLPFSFTSICVHLILLSCHVMRTQYVVYVDDIHIDEPASVPSTSSPKVQKSEIFWKLINTETVCCLPNVK